MNKLALVTSEEEQFQLLMLGDCRLDVPMPIVIGNTVFVDEKEMRLFKSSQSKPKDESQSKTKGNDSSNQSSGEHQ